ncbi:uncharacterized protein LOC124293679 [Neodiprion lecontei]|uniref:Uncharacterized protein LOC124293679 n=1 Tax=Neodiprion lecontei TaxID=441921 RepID=A0ABM3FU71_NEOLC|nr:uncharacterized protein LOC124178919 [Neodiprion fabricii]XP_046591561.1 uncharacterized protein LOC124293679 [Neodiprion lecontei]
MWTWFAIAALAKLLVVSSEVDFSMTTNGGQRIVRNSKNGEVQEDLTQATLKPLVKSDRSNDFLPDIGSYRNAIFGLIKEISATSAKMKRVESDTEHKKDKRLARDVGGSQLAPLGSWMSWVTLEDKAVPMSDRSNPWHEIKKSRAFSPWGGKRVAIFGQGSKVRRPMRIPFNSWGGKRSDGTTSRSFAGLEKRARFSNWGGKRGWESIGTEKRTKFNAWGGKRSKNGERDDEEMKRTRFNAWGGKRSEESESERTSEEFFLKKKGFNAWGGKRFVEGELNADEDVDHSNDAPGSSPSENRGRERPDSSSGEEGVHPTHREMIETGSNYLRRDDANEIPPFESEIMELPERRGVQIRRSAFNPWGGRKRGENAASPPNLILPEADDLQEHRHQDRF